MEQELVARRVQAESAFNALQNSIQSVKNELRKYGCETLEEAHEELMRLQGEFRVISDLLERKKAGVSPDTIDATVTTQSTEAGQENE